MQISVLELKAGDYIPNFGVVTSVQYFSNQSAGGLEVQVEDDANFTQRVKAAMDSCYSRTVDRVVAFSGSATKGFYSDASLDVIRAKVAA